jgi:hypothetical protein
MGRALLLYFDSRINQSDAPTAVSENGGWKIKQIVFVGGTCGSVHAQTFNENIKELGVVESKRNTIQKGFVDECLMHKTRSCAHTLHKDRVSGVRV